MTPFQKGCLDLVHAIPQRRCPTRPDTRHAGRADRGGLDRSGERRSVWSSVARASVEDPADQVALLR